MSRKFGVVGVAGAVTLGLTAFGLAGCGGASGSGSAAGSGELKGQTIEVAGPWSGGEQKAFEKVLSAFERQTGATVHYTAAGDDMPTVLQSKVQGGAPPNVAILAQPGAIAQFARQGVLKPVGPDVEQTIDAHESKSWKDFGTVDGKTYGVYFKAANKSIVWYNDRLLTQAGFKTPNTWDEFLAVANGISDTGVAPIAVAGADGWTLTDWFENVYLQTAGGDMYDKLTRHQIPWTDPSVKRALLVLQQVFQPKLVADGNAGALQTDFSSSVTKVFSDAPKAAMVFEADFVGKVIHSDTKAKVGDDARFFPFPTIGKAGGKPGAAVVTGGDAAVALKDDKATMALLKYLATPEAGVEWARSGGFLSPNKDMPLDSYTDDLTRNIAKQMLGADSIRFDMSDQAPAEFGATKGAGEWKDLSDFLANPGDIDGITQRLEADAAKAYHT
jgi:alpha-glucoside transport system substrate-binding protein